MLLDALDIFRVDWILVDIIIIVLLIIFLVSVKIFKTTHRWRNQLSNEMLECIYYKEAPIKFKSINIVIKNLYLIRNRNYIRENKSKPILIVLRTNQRKKLLNILAEGLSSYGINVISIKLKIKPCLNCDILDKTVEDELKYTISTILNYFDQNDLITNSNYFALNYSKSNISYNSIVSDSKNLGIILINPILSEINKRNFKKILDLTDLKTSFNIIFSKKTNYLFANKNLALFFRDLYNEKTDIFNLWIRKKAKKSFKYYETILLSIIIDIIESKTVKSLNI